MEEKKFIITQPQLQALVDYLGAKPFVEVVNLIVMIQSLVPMEEPKEQ